MKLKHVIFHNKRSSLQMDKDLWEEVKILRIKLDRIERVLVESGQMKVSWSLKKKKNFFNFNPF